MKALFWVDGGEFWAEFWHAMDYCFSVKDHDR